jgi:hypothetical protein
MDSSISHRELCLAGAKYIKNHGVTKWQKPTYVVCELERVGESPDIFGFGLSCTQLIEVKVSRLDFIADKNKYWRKNPSKGIGQLRAYLCPVGVIKLNELPKDWGLLYYERGKILVVREPCVQISNSQQEMNLAASILRREGIKSKVFDYKKYNK